MPAAPGLASPSPCCVRTKASRWLSSSPDRLKEIADESERSPCSTSAESEGKRLSPTDEMDAKLLNPLKRDWLSKQLGLLEVRAGADPGGALQVWEHPEDVSSGAVPLGSVSLRYRPGASMPRIEFEHTGQCWRLVSEGSRRKRVRWCAENGEDIDWWDADLIDTMREAASRVTHKYDLNPHLDACWPSLSRKSVPTQSPMTVGLCTASKNRLWQLRLALPLTLLHCWQHRRWTRVHVVDYGSTDGTLDWILNRCHAAIDCGLLRVYRCEQPPEFWHASVAKNTSHRVAEEEVLVNVDGDNLVGPDFPVDVVKHFQQGYTVLQYEWGQGTCGRIAYRRQDFMKLRGYDEDAHPMGAQDVDLVSRLKELPGASMRKTKVANFSQAIMNTQAQKICCCDPSIKLRWGKMDSENREVFKRRRSNGELVRNQDKDDIGISAIPVDKYPRKM